VRNVQKSIRPDWSVAGDQPYAVERQFYEAAAAGQPLDEAPVHMDRRQRVLWNEFRQEAWRIGRLQRLPDGSVHLGLKGQLRLSTLRGRKLKRGGKV
jgi:hypothetical protein